MSSLQISAQQPTDTRCRHTITTTIFPAVDILKTKQYVWYLKNPGL